MQRGLIHATFVKLLMTLGLFEDLGIGEAERLKRGLYREPCNGEGETIGDILSPQLEGLFAIPSSTLLVEKSMATEATLVAENKT